MYISEVNVGIWRFLFNFIISSTIRPLHFSSCGSCFSKETCVINFYGYFSLSACHGFNSQSNFFMLPVNLICFRTSSSYGCPLTHHGGKMSTKFGKSCWVWRQRTLYGSCQPIHPEKQGANGCVLGSAVCK